MDTLLIIGKTSLYLALFYTFYWLLLRKQTHFKWNRWFLLGALLLSLSLPFLKLPEAAPVIMEVYDAEELGAFVVTAQQQIPWWQEWPNLLLVLYGAGLVVALVRFVERLKALYDLSKKGESICMDNVRLVLFPDDRIGSFSFFRLICISRSDYEYHFDQILKHEMIHVRQWHSLDILLTELLQVVLWFHPLLPFYRKSLQEVHEYLADREITDRDGYALFLVNYAMGAGEVRISNCFFRSSLLKRRIRMLYKKPDSRWVTWKYLTAAPLLGLLILLTAAREGDLAAGPEQLAELLASATEDRPTGSRNHVQATTSIPRDAQPGETLRGKVVNDKGVPVSKATVFVRGTNLRTQTDASGQFVLEGVPAGSEVIASQPDNGTAAVLLQNHNPVVLTLSRKAQDLDDLVVVAYAPQNKPEAPAETIGSSRVDEQPRFPGGVPALYNYLARNIRYPAEAARAGVQGKVFVQFTVNHEGNIREPKVLKGLGHGIDEEAVRVVLNMPRWQPAKQYGEPVSVLFTLPVNFQIDRPRADAASKPLGIELRSVSDSANSTEIRIHDHVDLGKNPPLYVVDGQEKTAEAIKKLKPDTIEKIEVLKGPPALEKYGNKAENGVILITTKK